MDCDFVNTWLCAIVVLKSKFIIWFVPIIKKLICHFFCFLTSEVLVVVVAGSSWIAATF